ncbi:MAG TPA: glycosyltransferase [Gemmatimonadaceae bacterium]|nr:glycosyltransferase [Gemmatimonadaceae bacterium]
MHIFFAGGGTGGHLYPALAIARALVRADSRVEPFFIGARRGIERDILPDTGFPFELLDLHPLYRSAPLKNWRTVIGATSAWRRLADVARTRQPAALVATGGYAAGVALAYASRHRIPIVIQEQNSFPGMTVRYFARRAAQIHLGFPEAAAFLRRGPRTQIIDSGNPVDLPPLSATSALPSTRLPADRQQAVARWGFSDTLGKTMLIFGGSQGSEAINRVVGEWITQLGDESKGSTGVEGSAIRVIWATGKGSYAMYQHLESATVKVRPYIAPMADAYAAADFALCRAGAMTAAELAVWGIPAIMVPLPTAAGDHQTANAKALAAADAAILLPQTGLTAATLAATVNRLSSDAAGLATMRQTALHRARPHAADDIATHILTLL